MGLELNKSDLAALFDVHERRIAEWQQDHDFPQPRRGNGRNVYDATAVLRWWHEREVNRQIEVGDSLDLAQERAALAKAQRERQELALHRDRGGLVDVEVVVRQVEQQFGAVRQRLLMLPPTVAGKGAGHPAPQLQEIVMAEVTEVLRELSTPEEVAEAGTDEPGG